ncbi:MAG: hypothetical protein AB7Q29_14790 [Vicinamibacterales bacterium]
MTRAQLLAWADSEELTGWQVLFQVQEEEEQQKGIVNRPSPETDEGDDEANDERDEGHDTSDG